MSRHSILIVDDEANQRLMIEQALRVLADDWSIATSCSAQEALDAAMIRPPDLIITDYHMPLMNGLELIARLRGYRLTARIILITAYSTPELTAAAQRLAVDYSLTKPVPLALLRSLAAAALESTPALNLEIRD